MKKIRRLSMLMGLVWLLLGIIPSAYPASVEWGTMQFDSSRNVTVINADPTRLGASGSKVVLARTTIPILATGQTYDVTVAPESPGSRATRIVYETCDNTNNVTFTLSVLDPNGVILWQSAAYAEATLNPPIVDIELINGYTYTFRTVLSGVAGGLGCNAYLTVLGY